MSAAETFAVAQAAGVRLSLDGVDLLVESDREPSSELVDVLRRDKSEILALLRSSDADEVPPPTVFVDSPSLHGLTPAELEDVAGEVWAEVRDAPAVLEAMVLAAITRCQREQGECPQHWTEHCECLGCGPVFSLAGQCGACARLPLVPQPRSGTADTTPWGPDLRNLRAFLSNRPAALGALCRRKAGSRSRPTEHAKPPLRSLAAA